MITIKGSLHIDQRGAPKLSCMPINHAKMLQSANAVYTVEIPCLCELPPLCISVNTDLTYVT